ncbi:MAG: hypothetical protein KTR15_03565 [Phycisphaeraceae bacterium]|nr:hypothetical protein [Phycisphaeraceae bacterium]
MPEDEFELYLTLLAKTLRLSDEQRDAIAAELRDHMENRLRELTLQGIEREQAIEAALAEFGDASALAKDLTKTDPTRTQARRHLMQTTFGTLIACAAVTFAVMLFTPSNKDGQPNQPGAIAQGESSKVAGDAFGAGFDAGPETTDFGATGVGVPGGFSSPDRVIVEKPKLDLSIRVVDCTEILRAEHDKNNLYQRTNSLAEAVEETVATVNKHGELAIRVQPFEEFIIITATDSAHDEASRLLDQIGEHVNRRAKIQKMHQHEQAMLEQARIEQRVELELDMRRVMLQIEQLMLRKAELTTMRDQLLHQHTHDHPQVKEADNRIQEIEGEIEALQAAKAQLEIRARTSR